MNKFINNYLNYLFNKLPNSGRILALDSLNFISKSTNIIRFNLIIFLLFGSLYASQLLKWEGQLSIKPKLEKSIYLNKDNSLFKDELIDLNRFYYKNKENILSKLDSKILENIGIRISYNKIYKELILNIISNDKKEIIIALKSFNKLFIEEYKYFVSQYIDGIESDINLINQITNEDSLKTFIIPESNKNFLLINKNLNLDLIKLKLLKNNLAEIKLISSQPEIIGRYNSITLLRLIIFLIISSFIFSFIIRFLLDTLYDTESISKKIKKIPFPLLRIFNVYKSQENLKELEIFLQDYTNQNVCYLSLKNLEFDLLKKYSEEYKFFLIDANISNIDSLEYKNKLLFVLGSENIEDFKISQIINHLITKDFRNIFLIYINQI
tara:strand:- start:48 stop:1193 length:1146 start_codon:yes stop_codon:yes gene_type:complete